MVLNEVATQIRQHGGTGFRIAVDYFERAPEQAARTVDLRDRGVDAGAHLHRVGVRVAGQWHQRADARRRGPGKGRKAAPGQDRGAGRQPLQHASSSDSFFTPPHRILLALGSVAEHD